jgi:hypothetical protein
MKALRRKDNKEWVVFSDAGFFVSKYPDSLADEATMEGIKEYIEVLGEPLSQELIESLEQYEIVDVEFWVPADNPVPDSIEGDIRSNQDELLFKGYTKMPVYDKKADDEKSMLDILLKWLADASAFGFGKVLISFDSKDKAEKFRTTLKQEFKPIRTHKTKGDDVMVHGLDSLWFGRVVLYYPNDSECDDQIIEGDIRNEIHL